MVSLAVRQSMNERNLVPKVLIMAIQVRLTLLVVLLSAGSLAAADDAYWTAVGGAGAFGQSKDIRMAAEDVQVRLYNRHMRVRASFDFRNDGPAETVTMAFPETMERWHTSPPFPIQWFHSWVDGRRVRTVRQKMPLKTLDEYASTTAVWLKKVSFPAHGRRHVVCEYDAVYPGVDYTDAHYILRSGATWKGPIGDCRLHVDWSALRNRAEPIFSASDAPIMDSEPLNPVSRGEKWANFRFHDIEPKFNLEMMWANCFWNFRVNGQNPGGMPMGNGEEMLVKGSGNDPLIQIGTLPMLLDPPEEETDSDEEVDDEAPKVWILKNGTSLEFPNRRTILINGKPHRLRHALDKGDGPSAPETRFVHVRDVVRLLGGTYRYIPKFDRADIWVPGAVNRKS